MMSLSLMWPRPYWSCIILIIQSKQVKYTFLTIFLETEKLEMLFAELENELKKIGNKCGKFVNEYKLALSK
jgi:hypothetical protein